MLKKYSVSKGLYGKLKTTALNTKNEGFPKMPNYKVIKL